MKYKWLLVGFVMLLFIPLVSAVSNITQVNTSVSSQSNTNQEAVYLGLLFTPNNFIGTNNQTLFNATVYSGVTYTQCLLWNSTATTSVLANVSKVGNVCTFNYQITQGTTYFLSMERAPTGTYWASGTTQTNDLKINITAGAYKVGSGAITNAGATGYMFTAVTTGYDFADAPPNASTNATIGATDFYTSTSLNNFSVYAVNASGFQHNTTTTNGTAYLPIYQNSSQLWNISVNIDNPQYNNVSGRFVTDSITNSVNGGTDGDFNTYVEIFRYGVPSAIGYIYYTYNNSLGNVPKLWTVKDINYTLGTAQTVNLTLPANASTTNVIRLRAYLIQNSLSEKHYAWQYYDGYNWITLREDGLSNNFYATIYDQVLIGETQINSTYFLKTLLNQNISSAINTSIAQSVITFNAKEKYTNNTITSANFSTSYLTNVTHYMKAGTYNVLPYASGYYTVSTFNYTATALMNTSYDVSNLYNATLNVTLRYYFTNASITNFTLNLYNAEYGVNETYNAFSGYVLLNLTNNINYTITVNASNAFTNTSYVYQTNNATNYTIYTFPNNEVYITFRDEETLEVLSNVTYSLISASDSLNGTSSNGLLFLSNLSQSEYELRYSAANYVPRSYYIAFPITDTSLANLTVYSLQNASATIYDLYVTDKYDLPQNDLKVSLLRRYPISGQTVYYVVEQMKPSYALSGQTTFSAVASNVAYLFRVENSAGDIVFQGAGTTANNLQTLYLISNPIYIRVTLDSNPFTIAQNLEGVSASLTNTTSTFWFSVSDANNVLGEVCLKVIGNQSTSIYDYCTSDTSTILSYATVNGGANNSYYTAYGYVKISGISHILAIKQIDYRSSTGSTIYGVFGLFLTLVGIITMAVAFADKPMFMAIGIVLVLVSFGSQVLGFIWLSPLLQGSLIVLSIIVAYIMRDD